MPLFKKKRAITAGAVVTLKSGGRKMTIAYINDDNKAKCMYDDPKRGIMHEFLNVSTLKIANKWI